MYISNLKKICLRINTGLEGVFKLLNKWRTTVINTLKAVSTSPKVKVSNPMSYSRSERNNILFSNGAGFIDKALTVSLFNIPLWYIKYVILSIIEPGF